jgi:hypothetical protein
VDPYCADRPLLSDDSELTATQVADLCLERYPRDLRRALALAECGHLSAGHAILLRGLLDARELAHVPLQRVYGEALLAYEDRYALAAN